jgi:hypothetical protein
MKLRVNIGWLALAVTVGTASAADKHLGVATCAGSACHGGTKLSGTKIRQDEYLVWQRQDRHAQAYATLRSDRSRRIAANLGLGEPTQARDCLVCHADAVPAAERGERFQLSDGVGCEVCHGAAQRWLAPHTRGYASHRERLGDGLFPAWESKDRARMCLTCHQGSPDRPMTHAIMGAGHPPLLFELDTFCALQPAHNEVDADYVARKGKVDDARNWVVGQVLAAQGLLAGVAAPAGDALFPELNWFDCNACHHPLQPPRWEAGIDTGLPPGRPRLADAPLYFTGLWLDAVKPELAARWREAVKAAHAATMQAPAGLRERATAAGKLLESEILPLAMSHEHSAAELRKLALSITETGAGPRVTDFSVAEQSSMATAVMVTALQGPGKTPKGVREAIDAIYAAVADRNKYDPDVMRKALRAARDEIGRTYK